MCERERECVSVRVNVSVRECELQDKYDGVSRISQFQSEITGPTYKV